MKLIHIVIIMMIIILACLIAIVLVVKLTPKYLHRKIIKRILFGPLVVIILSTSITAAVIKYIPTRLNVQYKSSPKYYKSSKPIGKALVIYEPAWTSITKNAAEALAESLKYKGYDVTVNYPGSYLSHDVSRYDILVFGTPVYNSNGSSLVVNYIKSLKILSGKKIILFTTGSTTPLAKDSVYDGIKKYISDVNSLQRIKFSNKTDNRHLADVTVKKLCSK